MGIEGQFRSLTAPTRREPASVKEGRGNGYLYDIRRFAMLEKNHEYDLARRWRENGDRDAANELVTSHLRLAAKVAMGYRGYGLPISEIISEGNVGLMHALNRYEPERGFRFSTYAIWWIRASIQDYILRS
jgi:RNA polymerase sigma-32 factor